MAASGSAIRVMSEPKIETVAAVQTRTKAALRQSGEANGLRTSAEHSGRIDGLPGATGRLRYTPRCLGASEPAHHPARPSTGAGRHHPTESRPGPCSTPSASGCARRSAA